MLIVAHGDKPKGAIAYWVSAKAMHKALINLKHWLQHLQLWKNRLNGNQTLFN